jgi:hypothetical protein
LLSRIEFDTSILKDDRFLSFNFSIKSIITWSHGHLFTGMVIVAPLCKTTMA